MHWHEKEHDGRIDNIKLREPMWISLQPDRFCEYCGRPNKGKHKCPHAVDPQYPCPLWLHGMREELRHIGVQ